MYKHKRLQSLQCKHVEGQRAEICNAGGGNWMASFTPKGKGGAAEFLFVRKVKLGVAGLEWILTPH